MVWIKLNSAPHLFASGTIDIQQLEEEDGEEADPAPELSLDYKEVVCTCSSPTPPPTPLITNSLPPEREANGEGESQPKMGTDTLKIKAVTMVKWVMCGGGARGNCVCDGSGGEQEP